MARTADPARREDLLEAALDYVEAHGVGDLSLRPLGKAIGASPRTLLYHFGSKEQLLADVMRARRARQRKQFAEIMRGEGAPIADACREIWNAMSSPEGLAAFKRSLETYVFALNAPQKYRGFLENTVEDWLRFRADARHDEGYSHNDSRAIGTIVVAGFRGFLLDLCATGDYPRVNRAVDLWIDTLESLPSPAELTNAHA
jgi:AcrR family transcriptional regulator